jgi:DNA-binding NarL/FixJ family response regulator
MPRVLLVDDHLAVAEMMRIAVETLEGFMVVGRAGRPDEALAALGRLRPDVVVLDLDLAGADGLALLPQLLQAWPAVRTLVFSGNLRLGAIRRALVSGAHGVVEKTASLDEFHRALRSLAAGNAYYSRFVSEEIRRLVLRPEGRPRLVRLTNRDRELLAAIAEGLGSKEISTRLGLSPFTIVNHRTRLTKKLGLKGSAQLARFAASVGLVPMHVADAPVAI